MDDSHKQLADLKAELAQALAAIRALHAESEKLRKRLDERDAESRKLRDQLDERDAEIRDLKRELQTRRKTYQPKANTRGQRAGKRADRRTKEFRKHPGVFREAPPITEETFHHDVIVDVCSHCGSHDLKQTKEKDVHTVTDIPEPKIEVHCYHRHKFECRKCGRLSQGRGDLELPGAHIGPRARLFSCYARGLLGISLEKTADVLRNFFGLKVSRAGLLGHIHWGARLFDPVVQSLLEILVKEPVVQADETGWRINGKNAWAWCFGNARLAVFLIDFRRSREVFREVFGDSIVGTLVTDFYAVYDAIDCQKQRCLVHLLRALHDIREKCSAHYNRSYVVPLMKVIQDAIALGKQRDTLSNRKFKQAHRAIENRLDTLIHSHPKDRECNRINKRLVKYRFELLTFLENPAVPSDNSGEERDARSVACIRNDGGVNRSEEGAKSFGILKSCIRTCQKNDISFFAWGLQAVREFLSGLVMTLPLAPDTG